MAAGRVALDDGEPLDITKERSRLLHAKANLAELELSRARGEVILIDEAADVWQQIAGTIRSHMLALPSTVAPLVAGESSIMAMRQNIVVVMHEALEELSKTQSEVVPADSG